MNNNDVAQDELQQAINNITNASTGSAGDSADAVAQIEDRLNGKDGGKKEAPGVKKVEKPAAPEVKAPEPAAPKPAALGPIPAPKAPEPPAMPDFMKNATQPLGTGPLQASYGDPDLGRVKTNALSDLRPIIEKIDLPATKKFMVYKEIIEATGDKACIEPAYNAAKSIEDEKERAEALLFIVESINKLGVQMPKE
jgi:hypothetical protein